jgi:multiple sugar transport system substrate-binding protein
VALRDALPEYEKLTGVKVEWEELPFAELLAKQMTELVTKAGRYDIFIPSNVWNAQLAATGNVEVLDDYVAKAGSKLGYDEFFPMARDQYVYKGKIYEIPQSLNTYVSCWRTDVFEQEGIKAPADGIFTADEYMKIAKQLTKGGKYGSTMMMKPTGAAYFWAGLNITVGGSFFDEKVNPVFNSKEGLIAAKWWEELIQGAMPPDQLNYTHQEANEGMQRGLILTQAAQSAGRIPMINDAQKSTVVGKVQWGLLPFKGVGGTSKYPAGQNFSDGFGLLIPADSKNKQAAFDFIVWAVDKEKQVRWAPIPVLPTRKAVMQDSALQQKQPWLSAISRQLENTYILPMIPEWPEIVDKLETELLAGYGKQYSVEEALNRANAASAKLMKDRGYPVGTWSGAKLPWE